MIEGIGSSGYNRYDFRAIIGLAMTDLPSSLNAIQHRYLDIHYDLVIGPAFQDFPQDEKIRKLIGKISNGFEYWFSFVIQPGVEPTNNRAERAIREHVVQRKIIGTLRNSKGTSIHERLMTVMATWSQQGLDSLKMLWIKLRG